MTNLIKVLIADDHAILALVQQHAQVTLARAFNGFLINEEGRAVW